MRFKILTNCWINFPGAISGGDGESRTVLMRSWLGTVWSNKETSLSEVVGLRSTAKSLVVEEEAVLHFASLSWLSSPLPLQSSRRSTYFTRRSLQRPYKSFPS